MSKLLKYYEGVVQEIGPAHVWVRLDDESQIRLIRRRFNKTFGKAHAIVGRIVQVWVRQRRNGTSVVWGKPYTRVWTQEEIDEVERKADALWKKVRFRFDES